MPIHRDIDSASNLVTHTCSCTITKEDIQAAYLGMLEDPAFLKGINILWDFRNADVVAPSEEEIFNFAAMVKESQPRRGSGYKVAMVADKDLYYGLSRMYQAYSGALPFELMVFRSLDDALGWVRQTADN